MGFRWSRDDRSIGEGFRRIAREQIGKAIEEAGDQAEPPARRVHEARRRAKKLRALLRLVRPNFGHYARENAFLREAARGLSTARDAEVTEATLHSLLQWAGHAAPARVAAPGGGEAPALAGFAAKMQEMLERTEKWKPGKIGPDTLLAGLADTYRSGCEAMALVGEHPTDTAFHEWRKHAKYHWNQLKLLEGYAEQVVPAERKAAGDLADLLGLHHDLAVLRDMIGRDAAPLGEAHPGFVLDAAQRRQAELETEIGVLGRQVYAETPKALQARFRSYLEGWALQEAAG